MWAAGLSAACLTAVMLLWLCQFGIMIANSKKCVLIIIDSTELSFDNLGEEIQSYGLH